MAAHHLLFIRARDGNLTAVRAGIQADRSVTTQTDQHGNNLLMLVANLSPWTLGIDHHGVLLVQQLLQQGTPVDHMNDRGQSALFLAITAGNWVIANILLQHQANVNIITKRGDTALLGVITQNHRPGDHWSAISARVDVNLTSQSANCQNRTPLSLAIYHRRWHWVHWLMDRRALPDSLIPDGWLLWPSTPLAIQTRTQATIANYHQFVINQLYQRYTFHADIPALVIGYLGQHYTF
jgi:ankyrin repeat protein